MNCIKTPTKGMNDYLPADMRLREYVLNLIKTCLLYTSPVFQLADGKTQGRLRHIQVLRGLRKTLFFIHLIGVAHGFIHHFSPSLPIPPRLPAGGFVLYYTINPSL